MQYDAATRVIVIVTPSGKHTHVLPAAGHVTIGRSRHNDVCIDDASISKRHAALHIDPDGTIRVEDLGSWNGTSVRDPSPPVSTHPRGWDSDTGPLLVVRGGAQIISDRAVLGMGSALLTFRTEPAATASSLAELVSPLMQPVWETAALAARSAITVLITGETGVGKEVFAERIHQLSPRSGRTFLRVNCGSLCESLLESELFGYEKGAFTGAATTRPGLFEVAHQGTIFLDEIGELPVALQTRLLRVLDNGTVLRVGGRESQAIDVRVIAATNRRLEDDVAVGRFRPDLYFRLYGIRIEIPPLRERAEEIGPLAEHFLARRAAIDDVPKPVWSEAAMALLRAYPWPGNVRELRQVVERALILCSTGRIEPGDLPESVRQRRPIVGGPGLVTAGEHRDALGAPASDDLATVDYSDEERGRILRALHDNDGNQTRAARALGMSRSTLIRRLSDYHLRRHVSVR
jgi:two-component system, NtrC family, response regulator AtoC